MNIEIRNGFPTRATLIEATYQAIRSCGGAATGSEIYSKIIELPFINEDMIRTPHAKSKVETRLKYELRWSRTYLKNYGAIHNSTRAVWSVTKSFEDVERIDGLSVESNLRESTSDRRRVDLLHSGVEDNAEVGEIETDKALFDMGYLCFEPEGTYLERKSARLEPKKLAEHISAFGNAEGGKIIIGIEDNGEVTGFNIHQSSKDIGDFKNAPYECLQNMPDYEVEEVEVINSKGRDDIILIFTVEAEYNQVITLKNQSVFLRVSDKSRKLNHHEITRLEYDRGTRKAEDELVEYSSLMDVNEEVVEEFRKLLGTSVPTERLLKAKGFVRNERLTVAGLLLFSDNIQAYLPSFRIRFLRYDGVQSKSGTRLNVVKDISFERALPVAIREVAEFVKTQLRDYTFLGREAKFVSLPEYPEFCWFEGIINAIIHRSYNNQGDHIRISMYDDRLEIFSPGGLPRTVTLENMKNERYSRNPKIANTLIQYKWVRESNEGVSRIYKEMEEYFLHEPIYEEPGGNSVKLTLRNNIVARKERETGRVETILSTGVFDGLNDVEEVIVRYIYNTGSITSSKASTVIERSVQTARKWLSTLEKKGIIESHGSGPRDPKRYYTIKASDK